MNVLTMNIYINAWLDCSNPFISLHNKYDDDLLAHFNAEKVNQLICNGDIFVEDLQTSDPDIQLEVVSNLLAIKARETIKRQVMNLGINLNKRGSSLTKNNNHAHKKQKKHSASLFPVVNLQAI